MEQESKCCKILGGVGWVGAKSSRESGRVNLWVHLVSPPATATTAFVRVPEPRENNMS